MCGWDLPRAPAPPVATIRLPPQAPTRAPDARPPTPQLPSRSYAAQRPPDEASSYRLQPREKLLDPRRPILFFSMICVWV